MALAAKLTILPSLPFFFLLTGKFNGMCGSLRLKMACGFEFDCGSGLTDDLRRNWQPAVGAIVVYR